VISDNDFGSSQKTGIKVAIDGKLADSTLIISSNGTCPRLLCESSKNNIQVISKSLADRLQITTLM